MNRFEQARQAETEYHSEFYSNHEVFEPGSWIAQPNRIVMSLLERLPDGPVRILDLACGVGRNTLPMAQWLAPRGGHVVAVDLLEEAIGGLTDQAKELGVDDQVTPIQMDVEHFAIGENSYHYIIAGSCLEHLSSEEAMRQTIKAMKRGTVIGGIHFISMCTDVEEIDKATGHKLDALIEMNFSSQRASDILTEQYEGWNILEKQFVMQSIDEVKYNKEIEFRNNQLTFVVQKV